MTTPLNFPDPAVVLRMLRESLERLASPAESQIGFLETLGVGDCADELALEFDGDARVVPALVEFGFATSAQLDAVRAVDIVLRRMSGPENAELWTFAALRNSTGWQEVRKLAQAALSLLSLPKSD